MLSVQDLINEFSKVLFEGQGSIFIGSGISIPSRVPSWQDLLRDIARSRLNLELLPDDDLPLIAQHIVNYTGTRGPLVAHLRNVLDKTYPRNLYHDSLVRTNIKHLWTTNYDTLLEDTFSRHFDVTVRASDESISRGCRTSGVEIIKMHGCIKASEGKDLVVTQEDYENFFESRPATASRLKLDLLERQFLFIGYSYADTNIRNIVIEARRLGKRALRQHYIVIQRQKDKSKQARQKLWLKDLSRLGISACQIKDFTELKKILEGISVRSRGNTVFITGPHERPSTNCQNSPEELGRLLAEEDNLLLLDGQSTGTGRLAMASYMERCLENRIDIRERLRLFSNPYAANHKFSNNPGLIPTLKEWRAPLMRAAQIVVVYSGGIGTKAEVQLASELGCKIIPVPEADGDMASDLLDDTEIQKTLPKSYLKKARNHSVTAQEIVNCIKKCLRKNYE